MIHDMTKGNPFRLLLSFTVPIFIGNVFQQFYNLVDSIIVGQFVGVNALAAIGATTPLLFFVFGWITGMTSGFAVLLSQSFGAGDQKRLRKFLGMSVWLSILMTVLMTAGLVAGNHGILRLMNTPQEIFKDTATYIGILYWGLFSTVAYNILSAVIRAMGDSKTPLIVLMISSVFNIILDLLFVAKFSMGVAGAAYATVIAQVVAAVLCLLFMIKKYKNLKLNREDMQYSWRHVKQLLGMGFPMALQFSITAIGSMIVQVALNGLGTVYIAAFTAAGKIQNIIIQFFPSLGAGVATFAGQNMGAGQIRRIKLGVNAAIKLAWISSAIVMAIIFFFGTPMVTLFVKDVSEAVLLTAKRYFMIVLWFYPLLCLLFVYRNVLQGMGNGVVPMLGGIAELVARGLIIWLLAKPLGYTGICLADPLAWLSALIPLIPVYYRNIRRLGAKMEGS